MDDVYRERAHLVALLATRYPSHIGFTDDAEPMWAVVVIQTPAGQMSWHIAPGDRDLFRHVRDTEARDSVWDGHTTDDKYMRMRALIAMEAVDVSRETSTEGVTDGKAIHDCAGPARHADR